MIPVLSSIQRYWVLSAAFPASRAMRAIERTVSWLAWIGVASSLVGILDFIALVIILRFFVSDADYGIVRSSAWIFPILDYATDLGLSAAVIQRNDHDDAKISTVFWIK